MSIPVSGSDWTFLEAILHTPDRSPVRGRFLIDTGAAETTALFINRPFAEKHGLLELAGDVTEDLTIGMSGLVRFRAARLDALELGTTRIESPTVALVRDEGGVLMSDEFDGVVTSGLLSRFRVIFDYARKRVVLEPGERSARPFVFGRSGLLLATTGEDLTTVVVDHVAADSPAAEAGLAKGDIVLTVDGVEASSIPLLRLLERTRIPGETFDLRIRRGEAEYSSTVTTDPVALP